MTKIKGLIEDISGAIRVTKKREEAFKNAKDENLYVDPINQVARALHPAPFLVKVIKIEDVSITSRMFTFQAVNNKLPIFQAGNYVSIRVKIGNTITTRPYSISSAPYEARGENGFFSITVRRGKDDTGFVSNYLYDHLKLQDTLEVEMPFGHFYFESLRDSKDIVGIAGGSGITPFYSMAKEIAHGTLDYNLTILYGSISHLDIILEKELDEIERKCDRVKVIHVLSDENAKLNPQDLKGYISRDIIKKYSIDQDPKNGKTTYFICGPLPMYKYIKGELDSLNVPKRRIRMEVFGTDKDVSKIEGFPIEVKNEQYKITVVRGIKEDVIDAYANEPIIVALERHGILIRSLCRSGECGACRAKVLEGEFFIPKDVDYRRLADKRFNYIHTCSCYPLSDMKIKITIL